MTPRPGAHESPVHFGGLLAGCLAGVTCVTLLLVGGVVAGMLWGTWPTYRSVAEAAISWLVLGLFVSFAVGGGVATRFFSGTFRKSTGHGLMVGVILLLLVIAMAAGLVGVWGDVRSVKVELGLTDIPDDANIIAPAIGQSGEPVIMPSDEMSNTVEATVWSVLALGLLLPGASVLGSLICHRAAKDDRGRNPIVPRRVQDAPPSVATE